MLVPAPSRWRNPLAYPAGVAPGFDPSHIAARFAKMSVVSFGEGFYSPLLGVRATNVNGSPAYAPKALIGPGSSYTSTKYSWVPGPNATNDQSGTIAAIFQVTTSGGGAASQCIVSTDGSDGFNEQGVQVYLTLSTGVLRTDFFGGASTLSGLVIAANVPYFIATSYTGSSPVLTLVKRLDTGAVKTASVTPTGAPPARTRAKYYIGGRSDGARPLAGSLATAMYADVFTPMPALLQWAKDPWAFWYPPVEGMLVGVTAAPSFNPAWTVNSNFIINNQLRAA